MRQTLIGAIFAVLLAVLACQGETITVEVPADTPTPQPTYTPYPTPAALPTYTPIGNRYLLRLGQPRRVLERRGRGIRRPEAGGQRPGHGQARRHRRGAGGRDADGGRIGHRGRKRHPRGRDLHLPVDRQRRDHLNGGVLPVQENYILHSSAQLIFKNCRVVAGHGRQMDVEAFREQAGLKSKAFYTVIREMRLLVVSIVMPETGPCIGE